MFDQIINNVMGVGQQVMAYGAKLGAYIIPAIILGVIALFFFARHSYKCFKVVLPLAAIVLGSTFGVKLLNDVLATGLGQKFVAPTYNALTAVVSEFINPTILVGLVLALVLGGFCLKFPTFTVVLCGLGAGYVLLGDFIKSLVLSFPFVQHIVANTDRTIVAAVGALIALICALVCAYIIVRFFRIVYIVGTSVGACAFALGTAAMFIFATTSFTVIATLAAAGLGALVGIIFSGIQLGESDY
jgi:hypothetical protein